MRNKIKMGRCNSYPAISTTPPSRLPVYRPPNVSVTIWCAEASRECDDLRQAFISAAASGWLAPDSENPQPSSGTSTSSPAATFASAISRSSRRQHSSTWVHRKSDPTSQLCSWVTHRGASGVNCLRFVHLRRFAFGNLVKTSELTKLRSGCSNERPRSANDWCRPRSPARG